MRSVSASVSSPQPTPSSICFVECGSVTHCEMKNSTKPRVVAEPVVGVELRPALVRVERLVERRVAIRVAGCERKRGRDEDDALDPLRVLRGENQRSLRAERERDHERLLGPGRVQHRERVCGELGLVVRLARLRPVGLPVPARVESDHAAVPSRSTESASSSSASARATRAARRESSARLRRRPRRRPGRRPARRSPRCRGSARATARAWRRLLRQPSVDPVE